MSDTQNNVEIKVAVDAQGVEAGLAKVDQAAARTGKSIDNLANSVGLRPLGEGASAAAVQVDKSTKNMADAIQRATAAMSSGAKGSAEYYAALANSRGLKMDVLKPYLEQLDQATKKAQQAAAAQKQLDDSTKFLADLKSRAEGVGKTASQLLELRAAELGVSDAARPMIEQLRASEEAAGGAEGKFGKLKLGLIAVAGVAVAGAGMFVGMMKGAIDAADELGDLSKSTGVAVEDLAGLKLAAEQSGADLGGIADSINKLSMNIGKDGEKFRELGITAKDPIEAFKQLADIFAAIDDPQTRAALGAAALGKSWASAAPLLAEGGNRIGEMIDKGKAMSGMTAEMVEQSDAFNDKMAELNATLDGFKIKVTSDLLPGLNQAVGAIQAAYEESGKLNALWVALGATGAFLFTDEFSSAQVKLKNLKEELDEVQADLALATDIPAVGFVGRWLFGDDKEALEKRVKELMAKIKELQDAANPPTPFQDSFGEKFMSSVAAYRANQFIGGDKDDAAAKKREAEIKAEQAAYAGLISSIKERIAAFAQEAAGLKPLTEAQRLQVSLTERLAAGTLKLTPAHKAQYEALIKELSVTERLGLARKESEDFNKRYAEALDLLDKPLADRIKSAKEEAEKNEEVARTYGMSAAAIAQEEVARLKNQLARSGEEGYTLREIEYLKETIKLRERSAAALASIEVKDASKKAAEQAAAEWKRASEQIEQSLTDALLRGFESGKSFGRNLIDTLKNMFATLVLRPQIQAMLTPVTGNVASMLPGSAGGGLTSTAQTASNLYSMYKTGSAANSAASALGNGGTFSGLNIGAQVSQYMPMIATAVAAYYAGSAVAGGYKVGGTGLANVINSFGVVGGLVNRAFGMRDKVYSDTSNLVGSIGAGGFSGDINTAWTQKGGWFRSDKSGTTPTPVSADMSKDLAGAYKAIKDASADFAMTLGINADYIADRAQAVNIALGKDDAANQKAIADFFVGVGNTIAGELLPSLSKFQQEGEEASGTLQRLATGYALVDTALESIGLTFGAMGASSLEARERLLAAAGGLDAFAANTAGFQQNFLTEAERNAPVLKSVTEQLAAMGLSSVDTREEFKQVVLGLDLTTEAGAKQYGALMKLQAGFAQVYPAVDHAAIAAQALADAQARANAILQERQGLQDRLDSMLLNTDQLREKELAKYDDSNRALLRQIFALEDQETAADKAADAWDKAAAAINQVREANMSLANGFASSYDRAKAAAQALRDFNDSLVLGNLSGLDTDARYRAAKAQFEASNGQDTQAAQAFLQASKDRGGDPYYYARDFAMVQEKIAAGAKAWDASAQASLEIAQWLAQGAPSSYTAPVTPPAVTLGSSTMSSSRAQQSDVERLEAKVDSLTATLEDNMGIIADSTARAAKYLGRVTGKGAGMELA